MLPISFETIAMPFFIRAGLLILFIAASTGWQYYAQRKLRIGTACWTLIFCATLIFLGIWTLDGYGPQEQSVAESISTAIFLPGILLNLRDITFELIERATPGQRQVIRGMRNSIIILVAATIGYVCTELPWNDSFETARLSSIVFTTLLIAVCMLAAYAFAQHNGIGPAIISIICLVIGIAQYFILEFKGVVILPSDLLSLNTAATVANGYEYALTDHCLYAIALTCVAVSLLSFVQGEPGWKLYDRLAGIAKNIALGAALCGLLLGGFQATKITDLLKFTIDNWTPLNTYSAVGFIPSFLAITQEMKTEEPKGYSTEGADKLIKKYAKEYDQAFGTDPAHLAAQAQFENQKPTVIAIMDETFSDLSAYENLHAGYAGPTGITELGDALQRGKLMVSVYGGGTCNSEFEFLTGNSMAYVGVGKYPYMLNDFSNMETLPRQFKSMGYKTTAMHDNLATNWNRSKVYEEMGFDTLLDKNDIEYDGCSYLHAGANDSVTYEKILELLQDTNEPQFIFNVTMQNHGGYENIDLPEDLLTDQIPDDITDETLRTALTEYLGLMRATERDFTAFLDQLRMIDRPVVVVFFGDHQPSFPNQINDLYFQGEDELTHIMRTYQTNYVIWSNYAVEGHGWAQDSAIASASTLAGTMLETIGAPLSDFQKAQRVINQQILGLSISGYLGNDYQLYELDAKSPYKNIIDDLRKMQYRRYVDVDK